MVCLGYDSTQPVTMEEMIHHAKAVRRGAPNSFLVGDLPFGSYETGPKDALRNAIRFIKEAGVDAVKLEGGDVRAESVRMIVNSGIAVMGHIGLTPQGISVLGGFRAQGCQIIIYLTSLTACILCIHPSIPVLILLVEQRLKQERYWMML